MERNSGVACVISTLMDEKVLLWDRDGDGIKRDCDQLQTSSIPLIPSEASTYLLSI